jgi:hypothetical protein
MGWEDDRDEFPDDCRSLVDADRTVEDLADLLREMYLELDGSEEYAEWLAQVEDTFEEWELDL